MLTYTAAPSNGCGPVTWVITNGVILHPDDNSPVTTIVGNSVSIRWNDVAATGTLSATTKCGEEVYTEEKDFAIKSLKGRNPENLRATHTLPFCTTLTYSLMVDPMFLNNTGGSFIQGAGKEGSGKSDTINTQKKRV